MSDQDPSITSAIQEALRAKRDKPKSRLLAEIEEMEAMLLRDIDNFDFDTVSREALADKGAATGIYSDPALTFPSISASGVAARVTSARPKAVEPATADAMPAEPAEENMPSLLDQLRQQAESRQKNEQEASVRRQANGEALDKALRQVFRYLNQLVEQLNLLKPEMAREYPIVDPLKLSGLLWQQGFVDYRTQGESSDAWYEVVTFTCKLKGGQVLRSEREGPPAIERFSAMLFDFGLQFDCKEKRNDRNYLEKAEFTIRNELAVNVRWRADYERGQIVVEARNLERLGNTQHTLLPAAIDQSLLDAFGRLVLGQPARFRELARRS